MNRPLTRRETLAHLDALITAVSTDPRKDLIFLDRLNKLRSLVDVTERDEITLSAVHETLFEGLKPESRRTTFSAFRTALSTAAEKIGRSLNLVQPHARGKSATQIPLHFEGSPVSLQPDIDATTDRAVAGLDRQTLIEAPAAFLSGEFLNRLLRHFADPQTTARLPVRFFLSYAHKNDKLKDKLLDALRDELAISRRFDFSIWQDKLICVGNEWHTDIQSALNDCDLCLPLLSPAFLASNYIIEHEIPPLVAREIPAIPVELEPLDLKRHNTQGLENLQIFTPAFSKSTTTAAQKDFAQRLAHKIEEKVAEEAHAIAQRFAADYLSGKHDARELAGRHPELLEILNTSEAPPAAPTAQAPPATEPPARLRINSLLSGCLKSLPPNLITPYAATGDLESITREIARQSANDDAPDPYLIFQRHQRSAVDYLAIWARNPTSPPFAAVLGEIGSGKTTTLQMLAHRLSKDPAAPPVIFIDLREYFDPAPPTLEGILTDHLRRYDPDNKLTVAELVDSVRTQRAVIIFDGLDEKIISLADAARQNFIRELWRILPPEIMDQPSESGRGKLVISCRSHYFPNVQAMGSGYVGSDRAKITARDYLACVMLPWKDEQIREYLTGLLGEDRLETALDLIKTVHNLKDLASRPYLISLIGPELEELEKDRAAGCTVNAASLYRKFIERWLHRDDGKHVFTPAHKLRLMEHLAAALWRENARTWPWERVEEWLETFLHENPVIASALAGQPISVLQQDFRTATFFLRPDACAENFRFAHTSLQEYFLACHLARALEKSDAAAWDLPEPSRETFDFLGQHLLTLTTGARDKALTGLATLLGNSEKPKPARLNALRYHLQGHAKGLPIPEAPALHCAMLDLEGWEFHGTAERPLFFGETCFSTALLLRASFEHVHFQPGADFRGTDLRSTQFFDCPLPTADLRGSLIDGSFFRECDLTGIQLDPRAEKAPILAHLCPGSPWRQPTSPPPPSASFAHGHSGGINSATFSPDGKLIVSASGDKTLRIWDASSGFCIRSLVGHLASVTAAAFSQDGSLIASASHDKTLRIWDTCSGACIRLFTGHSDSVTSIAISWDGKFIVSSSDDMTLKIWEVGTGRCIRSLEGHSHLVTSVALSPDGALIASSSVDMTVRIWEAASGACISSLHGHSQAIYCVSFSPDGSLIASASADKTVLIWEVASGRVVRMLQGHSDWIFSATFSPDGSMIISASEDETVRIWHVSSGTCIRTLRGHSGRVLSAAFSPTGKVIVSASLDGIIQFWDDSSGVCIRKIQDYSIHIDSAKLSPDGQQIIHVGHSAWVFVRNGNTGELDSSLKGRLREITEVAFSPNGRIIAAEDDYDQIICWDLLGNSLPIPDNAWTWFHARHRNNARESIDVVGRSAILLRDGGRILREILPLSGGQAIVREPWGEEEAYKSYHEIRWKFVRGPKDAWRWCHVVDPETNAIHPPELAAVPGALSGPEVGPG